MYDSYKEPQTPKASPLGVFALVIAILTLIIILNDTQKNTEELSISTCEVK